MTPTKASQILMMFAANPKKQVSSDDLKILFDMTPEQVFEASKHYVQMGWLSKKRGGRWVSAIYSAGPELHKFVNRWTQ